MKNFIKLNTILIFIQSIIFFAIYSIFLGSGLNEMYTHKFYIFLLFIVLLIYFIPTFIASFLNKKHFLQIFLLNTFSGFTFIGWLAALIWATLKNNNSENYNKIISIFLQIICMLSFVTFCITDYKLFNYDSVKEKEDVNLQILLEYLNK